jgi:predicted glycoside hydrolase/deacetylase ChbG (UPF0249 family)
MKLIINADDFGKTKGINQAVFELARFGTLTSTTVMANAPYAADATKLLEFSNFSVGLHFNLTEGKPISNTELVPTLIDENGNFHSYSQFIQKLNNGSINLVEIIIELECQFKLLEQIIGKSPSHIDSHQNIHKQWRLAKALIKFSKKKSKFALRSSRRYIVNNGTIQYRMKESNWIKNLKYLATQYYLYILNKKLENHFILPKGELHYSTLKKNDFLNWLINTQPLPDSVDIYEVPCHPALNTDELNDTKMIQKRLIEFNIMRSIEFKKCLNKVTLVNYNNI